MYGFTMFIGGMCVGFVLALYVMDWMDRDMEDHLP